MFAKIDGQGIGMMMDPVQCPAGPGLGGGSGIKNMHHIN